jgi:hypothetical protein
MGTSYTVILVAVLVSCFSGCAPSRSFHVRGEVDRANWVVRTCDSGESYRVIMSSGQSVLFGKLEKQLGATASESLIIEFDGTTIPPKWPWAAHETIGVGVGSMRLERGTCRQ